MAGAESALRGRVSHGGRHWEEVWVVLSEIGHLYGFDQDSGIIPFTFLKPRLAAAREDQETRWK